MNIEKQSFTREQILGQVRLLLEPWLDNPEDAYGINEEVNLLTGLGLDSVAILQLVLGIEKQFNITIKDHELDSKVFSRMANLIDITESKINETD